jgi:ribonuclease HI
VEALWIPRGGFTSTSVSASGTAPITGSVAGGAGHREGMDPLEDPNEVTHLALYFDGASPGNPGPGGAGAWLEGPQKIGGQTVEIGGRTVAVKNAPNSTWSDTVGEVWSETQYLGLGVTNNESEYRALLLGLLKLQRGPHSFWGGDHHYPIDRLWVTLAGKRAGSDDEDAFFRPRKVVLHVRGDSELVIKQMRGEYAVNAPALKPLHARARKYVEELVQASQTEYSDYRLSIEFEHIPRSQNARADELANKALCLTAKVGHLFPRGPVAVACDAAGVLVALQQCHAADPRHKLEWSNVRPGPDNQMQATLHVPARFRAEISCSVRPAKGRRGAAQEREMVWSATLIEAYDPNLRALKVVRTAAQVTKRADPVCYDSDDPYEKLAFASGTHACYEPSDEDVHGCYLPVEDGEAAPELADCESAFEEECFQMFEEFESHIPGFEDAQHAMFDEMMDDPAGMAMGMYW